MNKQTLQHKLTEYGIPYSKRWGTKRLQALYDEYRAGLEQPEKPKVVNNYDVTSLEQDLNQLCQKVTHLANQQMGTNRAKAKRLYVFRDKIRTQFQLLNL